MAIFLWIFSSKESETVPLLPWCPAFRIPDDNITHDLFQGVIARLRDCRQCILIEWGKCRAEPIIHAWAKLLSSGEMNS
jgi:hypothetical protein